MQWHRKNCSPQVAQHHHAAGHRSQPPRPPRARKRGAQEGQREVRDPARAPHPPAAPRAFRHCVPAAAPTWPRVRASTLGTHCEAPSVPAPPIDPPHPHPPRSPAPGVGWASGRKGGEASFQTLVSWLRAAPACQDRATRALPPTLPRDRRPCLPRELWQRVGLAVGGQGGEGIQNRRASAAACVPHAGRATCGRKTRARTQEQSPAGDGP